MAVKLLNGTVKRIALTDGWFNESIIKKYKKKPQKKGYYFSGQSLTYLKKNEAGNNVVVEKHPVTVVMQLVMQKLYWDSHKSIAYNQEFYKDFYTNELNRRLEELKVTHRESYKEYMKLISIINETEALKDSDLRDRRIREMSSVISVMYENLSGSKNSLISSEARSRINELGVSYRMKSANLTNITNINTTFYNDKVDTDTESIDGNVKTDELKTVIKLPAIMQQYMQVLEQSIDINEDRVLEFVSIFQEADEEDKNDFGEFLIKISDDAKEKVGYETVNLSLLMSSDSKQFIDVIERYVEELKNKGNINQDEIILFNGREKLVGVKSATTDLVNGGAKSAPDEKVNDLGIANYIDVINNVPEIYKNFISSIKIDGIYGTNDKSDEKDEKLLAFYNAFQLGDVDKRDDFRSYLLSHEKLIYRTISKDEDEDSLGSKASLVDMMNERPEKLVEILEEFYHKVEAIVQVSISKDANATVSVEKLEEERSFIKERLLHSKSSEIDVLNKLVDDKRIIIKNVGNNEVMTLDNMNEEDEYEAEVADYVGKLTKDEIVRISNGIKNYDTYIATILSEEINASINNIDVNIREIFGITKNSSISEIQEVLTSIYDISVSLKKELVNEVLDKNIEAEANDEFVERVLGNIYFSDDLDKNKGRQLLGIMSGNARLVHKKGENEEATELATVVEKLDGLNDKIKVIKNDIIDKFYENLSDNKKVIIDSDFKNEVAGMNKATAVDSILNGTARVRTDSINDTAGDNENIYIDNVGYEDDYTMEIYNVAREIYNSYITSVESDEKSENYDRFEGASSLRNNQLKRRNEERLKSEILTFVKNNDNAEIIEKIMSGANSSGYKAGWSDAAKVRADVEAYIKGSDFNRINEIISIITNSSLKTEIVSEFVSRVEEIISVDGTANNTSIAKIRVTKDMQLGGNQEMLEKPAALTYERKVIGDIIASGDAVDINSVITYMRSNRLLKNQDIFYGDREELITVIRNVIKTLDFNELDDISDFIVSRKSFQEFIIEKSSVRTHTYDNFESVLDNRITITHKQIEKRNEEIERTIVKDIVDDLIVTEKVETKRLNNKIDAVTNEIGKRIEEINVLSQNFNEKIKEIDNLKIVTNNQTVNVDNIYTEIMDRMEKKLRIERMRRGFD